MGSSFIEYRGFGFWSFDPFIERLAGEVASAIEKQEIDEEWLAELSAHWKRQASGDFHGWVHLNLDEFLTGEDRRIQLRHFVEGVVDQHPTANDPIRETATFLLRLLDGKLATNAASPPDYMVGLSNPKSERP